MIIVSQDKDRIVNFDNVNFIDVDIENGGFVLVINYGDSDWENIGCYKTEERVKQIITEIVQSYMNAENYKYLNGKMMAEQLNELQSSLVYIMPKE